MQSKAFAKQCKERNRLKQAKWRLKKKQQQIATSSSSPTPTTVTTKSTLQLRKTVDVLTTENKKLKTTRSTTPPRQSATSLFLDTISPAAKTRATNSLKNSKNDLPRGSQHELRKELGINLSNSNVPKKKVPSPLHNRIEQFLNRDDISKPCPYKKKHVNDEQIRYRLNHLAVLHQQFEIETGIDIDYDTFCRHVPDNIKKPNNGSWGTCLLRHLSQPSNEIREASTFEIETSAGAFYFEQHVALQTGYVWLKDGSFSFGCLSDDTNHMAEAAWAGIQPLLNHLVDELEISTMNIISDSPIS
ncbi:unnamed protein product, partial [Rotaria sp. Silwood2]